MSGPTGDQGRSTDLDLDHTEDTNLALELGIPVRLQQRLAALDVHAPTLRRLAWAGASWPFVETLLGTPGVRSVDDLRTGLYLLLQSGLSEAEIHRWAVLGSLEAASRLFSKNVPVQVAESLPLSSDRGLVDLLRVIRTAAQIGIRNEDLPLWHAGGVVEMTPPYVSQQAWAIWRSVAAKHIGMRRAAVAAGAGLSPSEAIEQVASGTFDEEALRMMAALRVG